MLPFSTTVVRNENPLVAEPKDIPLANPDLGDVPARLAAFARSGADLSFRAIATGALAAVVPALAVLALGLALLWRHTFVFLGDEVVTANQRNRRVAILFLQDSPLTPLKQISNTATFLCDLMTGRVLDAFERLRVTDLAFPALPAGTAAPVRATFFRGAVRDTTFQDTGEVFSAILVFSAIPAKSTAAIISALLSCAVRDAILDADPDLAKVAIGAVAADATATVVPTLFTFAVWDAF